MDAIALAAYQLAKNGVPGPAGKDGLTPYVGENGNWWIGEEDTGVKAQGDSYILTENDKEAIAEDIKKELTNVYKYSGSVPSFNNLPSGLLEGDAGVVYNVEDTGMNYAWTGSKWDALGMILGDINYQDIKNIPVYDIPIFYKMGNSVKQTGWITLYETDDWQSVYNVFNNTTPTKKEIIFDSAGGPVPEDVDLRSISDSNILNFGDYGYVSFRAFVDGSSGNPIGYYQVSLDNLSDEFKEFFQDGFFHFYLSEFKPLENKYISSETWRKIQAMIDSSINLILGN